MDMLHELMTPDTEHINWESLLSKGIQVQTELYQMVVDKLTMAVAHQHSECILFDLSSPPYLVIVDSSEFADVLKRCLDYFVEEEEYELCGIIRDLIEDCEIEYV